MTTTPWILTSEGADQPIAGPRVYLPGPAHRIEVIAHSLAQINRYTGHATRPYSVAEHSLLVCRIVASMDLGPTAQLAALMHDAHEAITGDVSSPVKQTLGIAWLGFENLHARMLRQAHGLQTAYTAYGKEIKQADLIALATERRDLTRYDPTHNLRWPAIDTLGAEVHPLEAVDLNNPALTAMTWRHHRDAFLDQHRKLTAQIGVAANALRGMSACGASAP